MLKDVLITVSLSLTLYFLYIVFIDMPETPMSHMLIGYAIGSLVRVVYYWITEPWDT